MARIKDDDQRLIITRCRLSSYAVCSLELSTSSQSRPVFITILFLQPCQTDWIIMALPRSSTFVL